MLVRGKASTLHLRQDLTLCLGDDLVRSCVIENVYLTAEASQPLPPACEVSHWMRRRIIIHTVEKIPVKDTIISIIVSDHHL
jgi:hypothetical protein